MKDYKQLKKSINKNVIIFCIYSVIVILLASITLQTITGNKPNNILGFTFRLVISGSMEPEIKINSINLIKTCDISDVNIGDIVCFNYKQDIVHRVIDKKITESGETILNTKGDANEVPDSIEITDNMLVGKVIYTFNNLATLIDKYSIAPGVIDGVTLSRNIVLYGMLIGIAIIAILGIINNLVLFIQSIIKSKDFDKVLNTYIDDIDELILYRDILNEIIEKNTRNTADTRFEFIGTKLAKSRLLIECKSIHREIKGFKRGVRKAIFIDRLLTTFDINNSNIRTKNADNIIEEYISEEIKETND